MSAGVRCELISWERFYTLARQLAQSIRAAAFQPDVIVAIGRGGYMPARILSDYLDVFDLDDIKIEHYHGAHRERIAQVRYPLAAELTGRQVLLIDDVSDSGETFAVAIAHLSQRGEPAALKTAVLHHKLVSSYQPDFYAEAIREWRWLIYPWAVMEDLRSFMRDMKPPPASVAALARLLRERHGIEVGQQVLEDLLAMPAP